MQYVIYGFRGDKISTGMPFFKGIGLCQYCSQYTVFFDVSGCLIELKPMALRGIFRAPE